MEIGKKYTGKKGSTVRTLINFSDCEKYGYFKCETESGIVFFRWIFLNPGGCRSTMISVEVE